MVLSTDKGVSRSVGENVSQVTIALYVVVLVAVIVAVDFLFFKNRFWEQLTVNVRIVLVFAAFTSAS